MSRIRTQKLARHVFMLLNCRSLVYVILLLCMSEPCLSSPEEGVALMIILDRWEPKLLLSTWISGEDPCGPSAWENITCTNGHVTSLNVTERGLTGGLAPEIGDLRELVALDLSENNFQGPLPESLAKCEKIRFLDLSENPWNVSFPEVVVELRDLEELRFGSSGLSGSVPRSFYGLSKLKILYLPNNTELSADLESFSALVNLEELSLWDIPFNTEFPEALGNLKKLRYFNCHDCSLSGGLPTSFGGLTNLSEINLRQNLLTGNIPGTWRNLTNLSNLRIDGNFFLGPFPDWVFAGLPKLRALYLSRNQFHGTPPNISSLEREYNVSSRFRIMRWDCNYLEGPTPCQVNNPCSNETLIKRGLNQDNSSFYFYPNCYSDALVDDISRVANCRGHTETCESFKATVLLGNGCPRCPQGQVLRTGAVAANGCPCVLPTSETDFPVGAVVGGVVGGAVAVALLFLGFVIWKRKKNFSIRDVFGRKDESDEESADWHVPAGVQKFSVEELARITSNFSDANVIGHGGFGKVYLGTLEDGKEVAIKRAASGSMQGSREFRNEITLLSRLHHRHLVRLEGFCKEKDFQVLVYEYVKNGDLRDSLYGKHASKGSPLTAERRLEIAYGVAQGLEYLHSFANPPVIHRDIKPSNILLDDNYVAKVADFGISKESLEQETHVSTRPAGTAGFLDPEYFLSRQLTTASDVYAYGVLLLELITGQMAIDHKRKDEFNLIQWVKKRFLVAGVVSIIDPVLEDHYPADVYSTLTELALRCADFSKSERPTMKEVLTTLAALIASKPPASAGKDRDNVPVAPRQGDTNPYVSVDTEMNTEQSELSQPAGFTVTSEDLGPR